jgi:hypothetical protein
LLVPPLHRPRVDTTLLGAGTLLAIALRDAGVPPGDARPTADGDAPRAGRWRSADDQVRLDLRPDGSYRLVVAGRRRTASGTYRVDGTALHLCDASGLRTAGSFGDGVLELAGHELVRTRMTC